MAAPHTAFQARMAPAPARFQSSIMTAWLEPVLIRPAADLRVTSHRDQRRLSRCKLNTSRNFEYLIEILLICYNHLIGNLIDRKYFYFCFNKLMRY